MLKFSVYENGEVARDWPLRNVYLIGADGNPMRSEVRFEDGLIVCEKREQGTAALALQHRVGDLGELTVQTCLLPERAEPYLLALELARHRMLTVLSKMEDWAMLDLEENHPAARRIHRAHELFIESLCHQNEDTEACERLAIESLALALDGSEELALAHSELLLNKRRQTQSLPRTPIGAGVGLQQVFSRLRPGLPAHFDMLYLPTPWRALAPEEGEFNWQQADEWVAWAQQARMPILAGPLVSFEPSTVPDWLYIWEHDYDTVRDLIYEFIEKLVTRYGEKVQSWIAVSGLHVNTHFSYSFDQIMDLTRMATMLVKKLQPQAKVLIELREPFGEYYAGNARSIPPMTYTDLIAESSLSFDGFVLRLPMGQAMPGQYTRDLMQVSHLLDQFSVFNKPIHFSIAAPSECVTQMMIARPDTEEPVDDNSGFWRRPWSAMVQSHWLEAVLQIALSKPFVESVIWRELVDHTEIDLPLSGLLNEQLQPKTAFKRLVAFRRSLLGSGPISHATSQGGGRVAIDDALQAGRDDNGNGDATAADKGTPQVGTQDARPQTPADSAPTRGLSDDAEDAPDENKPSG